LPGASQFFQEREINVVYQGFYDVVVFLAGTDECDEMTCTYCEGKDCDFPSCVIVFIRHRSLPIGFIKIQSALLSRHTHTYAHTVTDLIVVVQELLCLACGGKKKISAANASVESEFLHKDGGAFAKFSIYVDHMMPHGFVASTNVDLIDKLAKGKPVV